MKPKLTINPNVLKWAREAVSLSPKEVVSKIKRASFNEETLNRLERGEEYPDWVLAETLAKLYGINTAVLYLPHIPQNIQPLKDFRTVSESFGRDSVLFMRTIQEKQAWMSNYRKSQGYDAYDFVGSLSLISELQEFQQFFERSLKINFSAYWGKKNPSDPLKDFIALTQDYGISVSHTYGTHGKAVLDVEEIRGFAIADAYAPFIFINSQDSKKAQVFTFVHEIIHLLIGESGVSDASSKNRHRIERFCNHITADLLMPRSGILDSICDFSSEDGIRCAADYFQVSMKALLIRLKTLGILFNDDFNAYYGKAGQFDAPITEKDKKKDSGGPSWFLMRSLLNGKPFSQAVITAYSNNDISTREMSTLLQIKHEKLSNYIEKGAIYG